jgi:hypothetical protein
MDNCITATCFIIFLFTLIKDLSKLAWREFATGLYWEFDYLFTQAVVFAAFETIGEKSYYGLLRISSRNIAPVFVQLGRAMLALEQPAALILAALTTGAAPPITSPPGALPTLTFRKSPVLRL